MDPFTAQGTWWVPNDRRRRNATGTISYSPQTGGTLEVFGKRLDDGSSYYVPAVYGDTERGPVTLLDCTVESASIHAASSSSAQTFSCEAVVVGAFLPRNAVFGEATVRVQYLDAWARIGRIEPLGALREGHPHVGASFYYRLAPGLRATLADGTTITLGTGQEGSLGERLASLEIVHQFGISANEVKPLDWILDHYVRPLVDLLTLVVDQPSFLLNLKVAKRPRRKSQMVGWYDYYDVGLRSNADAAAVRAVPLAAQLIRSDEFTFDERLPKWFELAETLGGIRGLVFGLRYASEISVENRFLNATTAAEALHRATIPSARAKVDLKNQATKDWIAQYPENEQNLIKTRLNQYINDPSLADRLNGLVDKAGVAISSIVPHRAQWVKLVKDTRNDLTHQEGIPGVRVSSRQMFVLAESVALLVTICFLVDLGFTPQELEGKLLRPLRIRVLRDEIRFVLPQSEA
jgi:ApeA N-terminal domain 1